MSRPSAPSFTGHCVPECHTDMEDGPRDSPSKVEFFFANENKKRGTFRRSRREMTRVAAGSAETDDESSLLSQLSVEMHDELMDALCKNKTDRHFRKIISRCVQSDRKLCSDMLAVTACMCDYTGRFVDIMLDDELDPDGVLPREAIDQVVKNLDPTVGQFMKDTQILCEGNAPIHLAAAVGNYKVLRAILDHPKSSGNLKNENKFTALHFVSLGKLRKTTHSSFKPEYVKCGILLLKKNNLELEAKNKDGQTAAELAASCGNFLVGVLLDNWATEAYINARDVSEDDFQYELTSAIFIKDMSRFERLLSRQGLSLSLLVAGMCASPFASPNVQREFSAEQSVAMACLYDYSGDFMRLMLASALDSNDIIPLSALLVVLELFDPEVASMIRDTGILCHGNTALHLAAVVGNYKVLKLLVGDGITVHGKVNEMRVTALHYVLLAKMSHLNIQGFTPQYVRCTILLGEALDLDIPSKQKDEQFATDVENLGDNFLVKFLVERREDFKRPVSPNCLNEDLQEKLNISMRADNVTKFNKTLSQRQKTTIEFSAERCVSVACLQDPTGKFTRSLLNAGLDPNAMIPLQIILTAIERVGPELAELLKDPRILCVGNRAIHIAAVLGNYKVIRELMTCPRTDCNLRNELHFTALHYVSLGKLRQTSHLDFKPEYVKCGILLLRNQGFRRDCKNMEGQTAAELAESCGNFLVKNLIKRGRFDNEESSKNRLCDDLQEKLIAAIRENDILKFYKIISRHEAGPNLFGEECSNPVCGRSGVYTSPGVFSADYCVITACWQDYRGEFIKMMIKSGLNINAVIPLSAILVVVEHFDSGTVILIKDSIILNEGSSAVHLAAGVGNTRALGELLRDSRTNYNLETSEFKLLPLHYIVRGNLPCEPQYCECAKLFLQKEDINVQVFTEEELTNRKGNILVKGLIRNRKISLPRELQNMLCAAMNNNNIEEFCKKIEEDKSKRSEFSADLCITLASLIDRSGQFTKILLEKRLDPNSFIVVNRGISLYDSKVLECLTNLSNQNGLTTIHLAAALGNVGMLAELLKDPRTNYNSVSEQGFTALHYISLGMLKDVQDNNYLPEYVKCVEHLLKVPKFDFNKVNINKQTAMDLAVKTRNFAVLDVLLESGRIDLHNAPCNSLSRNIEEQIVDAIKHNALDKVQKHLLSEGRPKHFCASRCVTATCLLDRKGDFIACLLDAGLDPNDIIPISVVINIIRNNFSLEISVPLVEVLDCDVYPIQLAAAVGNDGVLQVLLKHPNIDCHVVTSDNREYTALHYVALGKLRDTRYMSKYVICAVHLVDHGDRTRDDSKYKWTAMHLAVESCNFPVLKTMIESKSANLDVLRGSDSLLQTLLMSVGSHEEAVKECIKLLLRKGVNVNHLNRNKETALHMAARYADSDILEALVRMPDANVCKLDDEGRNLIHITADRLVMSSSDAEELIRCLEVLVNLQDTSTTPVSKGPHVEPRGLNVNGKDKSGLTPLYVALKKNNQSAALILMKAGASITDRYDRTRLLMEKITPQTLETYFDFCVEQHFEPHESKYLLNFKYKFLPQHKGTEVRGEIMKRNKGQPDMEMTVIKYIHDNKHFKHLLFHPLISSFIYLKYKRFTWLIHTNVIAYILFVCFLNTFIVVENFAWMNKTDVYENMTRGDLLEAQGPLYKNSRRTLISYLIILTCAMSIRELVHAYILRGKYFQVVENLLQVCLLVLVFVILVSSDTLDVYVLRHISVYTALLSWSELILLTGRLPLCSVQFEMLQTGLITFFTYLTWFFLILAGFAICFFLLFGDSSDTFINPLSNSLRTVTMMTGELEFKTLQLSFVPYTCHLVFLLFVLLVTMVLLNLLNGLAVRDTHNIMDNAKQLRVESRVRLMLFIDSLLLTKGWLAQRTLLKYVRSSFLMLRNEYTVQPNIQNLLNARLKQRFRICCRRPKIDRMDNDVIHRAKELLNQDKQVTEVESLKKIFKTNYRESEMQAKLNTKMYLEKFEENSERLGEIRESLERLQKELRESCDECKKQMEENHQTTVNNLLYLVRHSSDMWEQLSSLKAAINVSNIKPNKDSN